MNKPIIIFTLCLAIMSVVFISCEESYDPIGNNKPVPVLKLSTKFIAVPSTGGAYPINITSNVDQIEGKTTVPWVTGAYASNVLTVTAAANPDDVVRETLVTAATVTGGNEAQSAARVIQGNNGMSNIFANMLRSDLDADWKVLKPNGAWTIENNSLRTNSPGDVQSVMTYTKNGAQTVRSATKKFKLSVDVSNSNYWAGAVFHATDVNNFFYVGLNINPTSLFVIIIRKLNGADGAHAMDSGIALSADRDSYLRCEIVSTTTNPNQFTVNVYELKTTGDVNFNTDVSVVQKLVYTRTVTDASLSSGGFAGVWGKVGGGYFRRFVLTNN